MRQIAIFKSEPRQSETREIEYKAHWNSCQRTISYIGTNEHTIVNCRVRNVIEKVQMTRKIQITIIIQFQ